MQPSLSLLVPVYNAQSTLHATLAELLEVLPELTPRFEVIVVDDGSNDSTIEIAEELQRPYPQVWVVRQSLRRGPFSCLKLALPHCSGEIIALRDDECPLDAAGLPRMWDAIQQYDAVVARPEQRAASAWLSFLRRMQGTGSAATMSLLGGNRGPTFTFLHRRVAEALSLSHGGDLLQDMSRLGFHWQAIELRDKSLARPAAARSASEPFARGDSAAPRGGGIIQRPNYLSKIKRFALGE